MRITRRAALIGTACGVAGTARAAGAVKATWNGWPDSQVKPLFDAQELDGRGAGMPAYWEGAVTTPGGRGYLELTGYAGALAL